MKDAATTAIYGVAGGNGVIVVKTKSGGRGGKTSFSFDSFTGIQQAQRMIPVLNATEYAAILNEASVASGGNLIFPSLAGLGEGTNWQKEVFTNAPITSNNLSISGGNATSSFFISGGYLTQQGIVGGGDKSYFNRTNFTANFTNSMTNRLRCQWKLWDQSDHNPRACQSGGTNQRYLQYRFYPQAIWES